MNKKLLYTFKRLNDAYGFLESTRDVFKMREYESPITYNNNSRYQNVRTLRDLDKGRLFHENINTPYIPETTDDIYFVVTLDEENRLDIISNNCYQSARYWWVIAYANYIIDPFDVPVGMTLRIPPLSTLYMTGGILSGN